MKLHKYILLCFALLVFVSCEKESSTSTKFDADLLQKIAIDEDYISYRVATLEKAINIKESKFDLKGIEKILHDLGQGQAFCSIDEEILGVAKGGKLYKENSCKIVHAAERLEQKYPGIWNAGANNHAQLRILFRKNSTNLYNALNHINY